MSDSTPTPPRGSLPVVFLTVFIDLLGFGIVLPLLPVYADEFAGHMTPGMQGLIVGLLMSSFSAMQFFLAPVWGRVSDRVGRRPILLLGLLGSVVFYSLFAVAAMQRSLIGLFIARIGAGAAGATIATAQAYIADCTTKENRTKGMALIGAAFALGFTLGPLIAGASLLIGGHGAASPWPGWAAAALSAGALLLGWFRLPESLRPDSSSAARSLDATTLVSALRRPSIALLVTSSFIAVFAFGGLESTLSLLVEDFAERSQATEGGISGIRSLLAWTDFFGFDDPERRRLASVTAVFAMLGLTLTFTQGFLVRRLAGKAPEVVLAAGGASVSIAAFVGMAAAVRSDAFNMVLLATACEVMGFAFINPSVQAMISRRSDPRQQGGALGVSQSASSLARILGPLAAIPLFKANLVAPYAAAAIVMSIAVVAILVAGRKGRDYGE